MGRCAGGLQWGCCQQALLRWALLCLPLLLLSSLVVCFCSLLLEVAAEAGPSTRVGCVAGARLGGLCPIPLCSTPRLPRSPRRLLALRCWRFAAAAAAASTVGSVGRVSSLGCRLESELRQVKDFHAVTPSNPKTAHAAQRSPSCSYVLREVLPAEANYVSLHVQEGVVVCCVSGLSAE